MQEVRQSTSVRDGALDQITGFAKMGRGIRLFCGQHIKIDFGSREVLPETVMKFAGNTTSLFILHTHQS